MKERPILFSGEMVRAILEARKTQTRRVITPQPDKATAEFSSELVTEAWLAGEIPVKCPYGQPGDRLWVRETFYYDSAPYSDGGPMPNAMWDGGKNIAEWRENLYYRADGECCQQIPECCCAEVGPVKWRPSIFMPRWASRITLEITKVRVERVTEISCDDCFAEGIPSQGGNSSDGPTRMQMKFADLWDSLNEKRGFGWYRSPWVWVLEFKRVPMKAEANS